MNWWLPLLLLLLLVRVIELVAAHNRAEVGALVDGEHRAPFAHFVVEQLPAPGGWVARVCVKTKEVHTVQPPTDHPQPKWFRIPHALPIYWQLVNTRHAFTRGDVSAHRRLKEKAARLTSFVSTWASCLQAGVYVNLRGIENSAALRGEHWCRQPPPTCAHTHFLFAVTANMRNHELMAMETAYA